MNIWNFHRMRKFIFFLCIVGTLNLHAYDDSSLQHKIKKYNLKPLRETQYWKEHPHTLPYEKCFLYHHGRKQEIQSTSTRLIMKKRYHKNHISLFCYSKKLQTAFLIPIDHPGKNADRSFGLAATFCPPGIEISFSELLFLDDRSLGDLQGKYKGGEFNLAYGVGAGFSFLRNKGIWVKIKQVHGGFDLTLAPRILKLKVGSPLKSRIFTKNFIRTAQFLLKNDPHDLRLKENILELKSMKDEEKYTPLSAYWRIPHQDPEYSMEKCLKNLEERKDKPAYSGNWERENSILRCLDPVFERYSEKFLKSLKFKKIL